MDPSIPVDADETVDASGTLVFPGGVDTHSHLNDPGLTESEDFQTGTSGAAAGGYTTVLEMPQTLPLVDSVETFQNKLQTVAPKAIVDFGLYGALVPGNAGDLGFWVAWARLARSRSRDSSATPRRCQR